MRVKLKMKDLKKQAEEDDDVSTDEVEREEPPRKRGKGGSSENGTTEIEREEPPRKRRKRGSSKKRATGAPASVQARRSARKKEQHGTNEGEADVSASADTDDQDEEEKPTPPGKANKKKAAPASVKTRRSASNEDQHGTDEEEADVSVDTDDQDEVEKPVPPGKANKKKAAPASVKTRRSASKEEQHGTDEEEEEAEVSADSDDQDEVETEKPVPIGKTKANTKKAAPASVKARRSGRKEEQHGTDEEEEEAEVSADTDDQDEVEKPVPPGKANKKKAAPASVKTRRSARKEEQHGTDEEEEEAEVSADTDDQDEVETEKPVPPGKTKANKKKAAPASVKAREAKKQNEEGTYEYEVESILESRNKKGLREFLVKWKGCKKSDNTWEPEQNLSHCKDVLRAFEKKAKKDKYEVESILESRNKKGLREFLVKWKGYNNKSNTWEPEQNLDNCKDAMRAFEKRQKNDKKKTYEVDVVLASRIRKGVREFMVKWKGYSKKSNTWEPEQNLDNCKDAIRDFQEGQGEDYEVEQLLESRNKKKGGREFLVKWKGFSQLDNTWEPERNLHCNELIKKFDEKHGKMLQKKLSMGEIRFKFQVTEFCFHENILIFEGISFPHA